MSDVEHQVLYLCVAAAFAFMWKVVDATNYYLRKKEDRIYKVADKYVELAKGKDPVIFASKGYRLLIEAGALRLKSNKELTEALKLVSDFHVPLPEMATLEGHNFYKFLKRYKARLCTENPVIITACIAGFKSNTSYFVGEEIK